MDNIVELKTDAEIMEDISRRIKANIVVTQAAIKILKKNQKKKKWVVSLIGKIQDSKSW